MRRMPWWLPGVFAGIVALGYLAWAYHIYAGQPEAIFHVGDPHKGTGYDGQFTYFMALDMHPRRVAAHLDVPAYRYQRILLPLLAHLVAAGHPDRVLWAVWTFNFLGYLLGVFVWAYWVHGWNVSPWWTWLYALWPGVLLPLRLGMPEPLAYGLALAGVWAAMHGAAGFAFLGLSAALLAKEVTLPFVLAAWLWLRGKGRSPWPASVALVLWLLWQGWLWWVFGRPGLGIGGLGAEPPPPFPFGGLVELFLRTPVWFLGPYLLVFGPSLLVPLVLAGVWLKGRWPWPLHDVWAWLLGFHLLAAAAMPMFSWDPFAVFRVFTGFMVAFWAMALQEARFRVLKRLMPFWAVLLTFAVAR